MKDDKDRLKKLPIHMSDKEAEDFTDTADLSDYDLSEFTPVKFEFQKKEARLEIRVSQDQLKALKEAAQKQGIPHARLVRQFIEQGMLNLGP